MSRFNTGNPLGSGDPRDLDDNAKNMDLAVNSDGDTFQDRLGKSRLTWAGIVKAGSGDPAIAVDAAARAEAAASQVQQDADQIAQDAAQQAVDGVAVAVDGAVGRAEGAADRAEAAVDAAFVNADVYPDVATGRAAVADGEQFQVVEGDEIVRYRRDSSTTQTPMARYPSSALTLSAKKYSVEGPDSKNIWDGRYYHAVVQLSGVMDPSTTGGRCVILKVQPGTQYSALIERNFNRFRAWAFASWPLGTGVVGTSLVDGPNSGFDSNIPGAELASRMEFTTLADTAYVVLHLASSTGQEPYVSVHAGAYDARSYRGYQSDRAPTFGGDIQAKNIRIGKNKFDGTFVRQVVNDEDGVLSGIPFYPSGRTAVLKVEPGKPHTLSWSGGNRFRLATFKNMPRYGDPASTESISYARIIVGAPGLNGINQYTFTPSADEHYALALLTLDNDEAPVSNVQLELGEERTPFEAYGYEFFPRAGRDESGEWAGLSGGEGDARYLDGGAAWSDSAFSVPATDSTAEIQALLDSGREVVELEYGKKYLISGTLTMDARKVKHFHLNKSTLVANGAFSAIKMLGNASGTANPASSGGLVYNEFMPTISGGFITNVVRGQGIGIEVTNALSPVVVGMGISFMGKGLAFIGNNRNAIVGYNSLYANSDCNLYIGGPDSIHQINIFGNHISYSRKNIHVDKIPLYNMQITGNDIETGTYPVGAICNIHIDGSTPGSVTESIEIVGNTIEDHFVTSKMIILEGASQVGLRHITIAGNVIGNSNGVEIEASNVEGLDISGTFKESKGATLHMYGGMRGVNLSVTKFSGGGGLVTSASDTRFLEDVDVSGCVLSGNVKTNPVDLRAWSIRNLAVDDNRLSLSALDNYDAARGMICIESTLHDLIGVSASMNTVRDAVGGDSAVVVKVIPGARTTGKGRCVGNMHNTALTPVYDVPEHWVEGLNQ